MSSKKKRRREAFLIREEKRKREKERKIKEADILHNGTIEDMAAFMGIRLK